MQSEAERAANKRKTKNTKTKSETHHHRKVYCSTTVRTTGSTKWGREGERERGREGEREDGVSREAGVRCWGA